MNIQHVFVEKLTVFLSLVFVIFDKMGGTLVFVLGRCLQLTTGSHLCPNAVTMMQSKTDRRPWLADLGPLLYDMLLTVGY